MFNNGANETMETMDQLTTPEALQEIARAINNLANAVRDLREPKVMEDDWEDVEF